ncbi:MAG: hypothetical protein IT363_08135 [Methanoregulaceae archaeon]|nr:hypothetical protein [Methanoregulaceae archaeon]
MRHRGQRRTDILDTSDWAHRELVQLLRQATPERRLELVFDRIALGRAINEAGQQLRDEQNDRPA